MLKQSCSHEEHIKCSSARAELRVEQNLSPAAEGDCVYVLVSPGCLGPGKGVFADSCFVERAAFDAALSLFLGIFVAVDSLLRLGLGLDLGRFFVAVSALVEGRHSLCVLCLWVRPILLCLH